MWFRKTLSSLPQTKIFNQIPSTPIIVCYSKLNKSNIQTLYVFEYYYRSLDLVTNIYIASCQSVLNYFIISPRSAVKNIFYMAKRAQRATSRIPDKESLPNRDTVPRDRLFESTRILYYDSNIKISQNCFKQCWNFRRPQR